MEENWKNHKSNRNWIEYRTNCYACILKALVFVKMERRMRRLNFFELAFIMQVEDENHLDPNLKKPKIDPFSFSFSFNNSL